MSRTAITRGFAGLTLASLLAFSAAGCAAEPEPLPPAPDVSTETPEAPAETQPGTAADETPEAAGPEARTQADSCEWEVPALSGATAVSVTGEAGALADALVGSWQHTHFDAGSGFEPVTNDIRFVFPTSDSIIYCQDVPGVTDQAENRAAVTLDGNAIVLPGSAPGYVATAWSDSAMLWTNNFDGSTFLLQRR